MIIGASGGSAPEWFATSSAPPAARARSRRPRARPGTSSGSRSSGSGRRAGRSSPTGPSRRSGGPGSGRRDQAAERARIRLAPRAPRAGRAGRGRRCAGRIPRRPRAGRRRAGCRGPGGPCVRTGCATASATRGSYLARPAGASAARRFVLPWGSVSLTTSWRRPARRRRSAGGAWRRAGCCPAAGRPSGRPGGRSASREPVASRDSSRSARSDARGPASTVVKLSRSASAVRAESTIEPPRARCSGGSACGCAGRDWLRLRALARARPSSRRRASRLGNVARCAALDTQPRRAHGMRAVDRPARRGRTP